MRRSGAPEGGGGRRGEGERSSPGEPGRLALDDLLAHDAELLDTLVGDREEFPDQGEGSEEEGRRSGRGLGAGRLRASRSGWVRTVWRRGSRYKARGMPTRGSSRARSGSARARWLCGVCRWTSQARSRSRRRSTPCGLR